MHSDDLHLMDSYLSKVRRLLCIALVAVAALEAVLLVRGLLLFNLSRLKLRLYLYSYAFLLVSSLVTLILISFFGKKEECRKKCRATIYVYTFCFIFWSAAVTSIDCYASGDSGIIVYVMTCIAAGVLALLKPWVFACYLGLSSAFLLVATAAGRGWEPYSAGFYLNFAVFLATALFVNIHNYRLSLREYNAHKRLEQLSYTDQLTGLYNRRWLDRQMEQWDGKDTLVLLILDLDDFKQINNTYGHLVGDSCLQKVGQLLCSRFGQQVFRMGGDEFAVVSGESIPQVCSLVEDVNRELATGAVPLRISAGVYAMKEGDFRKEAFRNADTALYRAKKAGGGWAVFEP